MKALFINFFVFVLSILSIKNALAQVQGCTDPNASNFNASASENDGSCSYPITSYLPEKVTDLQTNIRETSGLILWNGMLWTINDSGNPAQLFALDSANGNVVHTYSIRGANNIDWEALAQCDTFIYIGDFGNNLGNRQDLRILKIAKNDLQNTSLDSIDVGIINFHYPEQQSFTPSNMNTPWDAEAFFWHNDSLHIFTKDWVAGGTIHYTLPTSIGTYPAHKKDSYMVDGLITDVSYNPDNGNIILLGYTKTYFAFAWLLFDYKPGQFFSGNKRRINLGPTITIGQTEGICFTGLYKGKISGESIYSASLGINTPAQLHNFDFEPYFTPNQTSSIHKTNQLLKLKIFPNPTQDNISFQIEKETNVSIINTAGKVIWQKQLKPGLHQISCKTWERGTYILKSDKYKTEKIVLK